MRPHHATAPDTAGAAAPDDTGYAAESSGCLVKGTADSSTMNTTYTLSVAVPSSWQQVAASSATLRGASDPVTTRGDLANLFVGTVEVHLKNGDEVWASCHGKVPLGKAGGERRAGRLGQPIEP